VYLCGTKYDLVQEDKKARKVEASAVERYGDGKYHIGVIIIQSKCDRNLSKTNRNI